MNFLYAIIIVDSLKLNNFNNNLLLNYYYKQSKLMNIQDQINQLEEKLNLLLKRQNEFTKEVQELKENLNSV